MRCKCRTSPEKSNLTFQKHTAYLVLTFSYPFAYIPITTLSIYFYTIFYGESEYLPNKTHHPTPLMTCIILIQIKPRSTNSIIGQTKSAERREFRNSPGLVKLINSFLSSLPILLFCRSTRLLQWNYFSFSFSTPSILANNFLHKVEKKPSALSFISCYTYVQHRGRGYVPLHYIRVALSYQETKKRTENLNSRPGIELK